MIYSTPCDCGNRIKATPVQAGAEIACDCGQVHRIPLLSELRRMMGQSAYEVGIIGTIHRMIRDKELPWGHQCCISRMPTKDVYTFCVQYEFAWIRNAVSMDEHNLFWKCFSFFLPHGNLLNLVLQRKDVEAQEFGRNRSIKVPLLVHHKHHAQLRRTRSQRKLRRWLRTVPIYDQLFREYPQAKVFT